MTEGAASIDIRDSAPPKIQAAGKQSVLRGN